MFVDGGLKKGLWIWGFISSICLPVAPLWNLQVKVLPSALNLVKLYLLGLALFIICPMSVTSYPESTSLIILSF